MKQRSMRGCLLYGIGFFVGFPLLLLVLVFLIVSGREQSAKRNLNERLGKIAAQGLPVDDETMLDFTNSLTSKEDTKEWIACLSEVTSVTFVKSAKGLPVVDTTAENEIVVPAPGQTWAEERATRDFLANWSELRNKISRLSLKQLEPGVKPVRFLTEFHSISTLLPQTQNMRSAAQLLMLNGQVAIFDRNSAKTKHSIEALIGCSRTVSGESILVSQLVCISIESMGIAVLKSAIEHDVLSEKDLVALLPRILEGISINPQWKSVIQGERALALPVFRNPGLAADVNSVSWLPGRSADALYYLDFIDQVLAVPDGDFDQFTAGLNKVDQDLRSSLDGPMLRNYDKVMTSMLAPAFAASGSAYVRSATQRRIAALCIATRLFEKRNGKMPNSLEDLNSLELGEVQFVPADLLPPGKQPFGYRVEKQQVMLWGFDINQTSSTPSQPPSTTEDELNAETNKLWIWTLRTK